MGFKIFLPFPRTSILTLNMVMLFSTRPWGAIRFTKPLNVLSGNASAVMVTACPILTDPMSVSSISAMINNRDISAIVASAVPPFTFEIPEAII